MLPIAKRKLERLGVGAHQKDGLAAPGWAVLREMLKEGQSQMRQPQMWPLVPSFYYPFYSGKQNALFLTWEVRVLVAHSARSPPVSVSFNPALGEDQADTISEAVSLVSLVWVVTFKPQSRLLCSWVAAQPSWVAPDHSIANETLQF